MLAMVPARAQSAGPPTRVVTLAPHITEIVFAAGAGSTVVGTVVSSNHPPQARSLPKVGDGAASVNAEALIRLKPDLVLAWQHTGAVSALDPLLQTLGIPLSFIAPAHLDDIPDQIEKLGNRLGTPHHASQEAAALRATLSALRSQYANRPAVPVFIEIGHTPLYAVGHDTMINDALRTCGGVNIFENSRLPALPIGPEHVLQKRPQVILVAGINPLDEQQAKERWANLGLDPSAGTHLHNIDPDSLFRPGPRLIEATAQICHILEQTRTHSKE